MAVTALANMIIPEEFNAYVENISLEKSELITSGIMTDMSAEIDSQLEGLTVHMPFFNDLDSSDAEQVLNDTADLSVSGITTAQDIAVKLMRGKAFGSTDLAGDLAGADPLAAIQNRFASYWNRRDQRVLLATLAGVMGSASMAGNVSDISGLTAGAENFDADSFIDAVFKLGDAAGGLTAIMCHSATLKAMIKADLIDFIPDSLGKLTIPSYMGKRVIVDDGMPVATGVYTTYLFGPGAVGYGSKSPKVPVEVERKALVGMGQEYVVHRRQYVMHVRGVKWVGTPTGGNPTPQNSDLSTTTNWTRVYENKQIRVVAFKHKLAA